jgi:hypothetical protein
MLTRSITRAVSRVPRHFSSSAPLAVQSSSGERRTSTFDTPSGTKDPYKTVSSGYPTSDQGVPLENAGGVVPEEMHDAASDTSVQGAQRPGEMTMDSGLSEGTKYGLIGG